MRSTSVVLVAAAALPACATYTPGSLGAYGQAGQLATVGCLDVAVKATRDAAATGPVVDYHFGNRCNHATPVDLGAVRVTGRTASGEEVAMVVFDPNGEIRSVPLDARQAGAERLEYRVARDYSGDVVQMCLDLGAIAPSDRGSQVTCLEPPPVPAPPPAAAPPAGATGTDVEPATAEPTTAEPATATASVEEPTP